MTHEEMGIALTLMKTFYSTFESSEETTTNWFVMFGHEDKYIFGRALRAAIKRNETSFPPTVHDVQNAIDEVKMLQAAKERPCKTSQTPTGHYHRQQMENGMVKVRRDGPYGRIIYSYERAECYPEAINGVVNLTSEYEEPASNVRQFVPRNWEQTT